MRPTPDEQTASSLAIVDARDWQNQFDLQTGEKSDLQGPLVTKMRELLQRHPYPGDLAAQSGRWVSDTALDLLAGYQPQFVFLTYAQLYFAQRTGSMGDDERRTLLA